MAGTVIWSWTKAIPSVASEVASMLPRGGWEARLGKAGLWRDIPRVSGVQGGSCLACLVSLPGPRLLGQLGPAVQEVIPEAGDVLRMLSQCAIQLVHVAPQALPVGSQ